MKYETIRFVNDKTRLILYRILVNQRDMKREERKEFSFLDKNLIVTDKEERIILEYLEDRGYIEVEEVKRVQAGIIETDILRRKKRITNDGFYYMKVELESDRKNKKYKLLDKIIDYMSKFESLLLILFGFLLGVLKDIVQWLLSLL